MLLKDLSFISIIYETYKNTEFVLTISAPGETVKKSVITDDGGKSDTQCLDLYELL